MLLREQGVLYYYQLFITTVVFLNSRYRTAVAHSSSVDIMSLKKIGKRKRKGATH
jgi:hypothetical protein